MLGPVFFRAALQYSGGDYLERGGMLLHDAVRRTVNWVQLLKIKAQVLSMWAKGCMLDYCV